MSVQSLEPKLRFPGFSGEWEAKKLGDIAELTSSKRVYLSDYVPDGIPFYRGKEISELKQNKRPQDILYISSSAYESFEAKFGAPQEDEILITAVGTLGNVLRIRNNEPFYFKDGNLIWLRNVHGSSEFLEIVLETNKHKLLATSIGSSQQALTIVGLKKVDIQLPSEDEQEKIAGFLTVVDERIAAIDKKVRLLQQYKKGVMQKIFTQKMRFHDESGDSYPAWQIERLGGIALIKKGSQLNKDDMLVGGRYPVLNGGINYSGYTNQFNTVAGTITISEGGNSCGYVSFVKENFWSGGHLYTLETHTNQGYLFHCLKYKQNSIMELRVGSGLPNIQKKDLEKLRIGVPNSKEQQKIADFLTSLDDKINLEKTKLEQAKMFKKSLLQRMFV